MKPILLALSTMILFAACSAIPTGIPPSSAETNVPTFPTNTQPAPSATEQVPVLSFEPQTYVNQTAGFSLDYPSGWTVNEMVIGDRGTQTQFLSAPELATMEFLPEGATRVNATVYQWDPKNDLAAYVANRKTAWDASGFTFLQEEQLVLASGLPAVQFTIQTPDRLVVFMFAAIGDQYLEISGEGNLELVQEIAYTLRPISP